MNCRKGRSGYEGISKMYDIENAARLDHDQMIYPVPFTRLAGKHQIIIGGFGLFEQV